MLPGTIWISPAHPAYYTVSSLAYPRRRGFILSSVTKVRARDEENNGPAGWEKRQRWSFISALYSNHTNYCFFLVSHTAEKNNFNTADETKKKLGPAENVLFGFGAGPRLSIQYSGRWGVQYSTR